MRTIHNGVPVHHISLIQAQGICLVAVTCTEKASCAQCPIPGLTGVHINQFPVQRTIDRYLIEAVQNRHLRIIEPFVLPVFLKHAVNYRPDVVPVSHAHDHHYPLQHEIAHAVASGIGLENSRMHGAETGGQVILCTLFRVVEHQHRQQSAHGLTAPFAFL